MVGGACLVMNAHEEVSIRVGSFSLTVLIRSLENATFIENYDYYAGYPNKLQSRIWREPSICTNSPVLGVLLVVS
jgi:hypothetical protein